jgi:hypothetical protein
MLKANIRWAVTGALFLILLGSLQSCANDPTSVSRDGPPECVWVEGVWICD